ncbi:hypothetical protein HYFRA_00011522 [Hymenoscyphus fraxineus]|uniref:Uncharacterized protein n=1 Tax=Hymenoscyphus fraxineus TaxID=746836 RepID=A0A9N9L6L3_9HELO|nr:hypothetical protein HYFRA_00011522 [Hymenoscyphus fraxineus]
MHSSILLLLASTASVLAAPRPSGELESRKQFKGKDGMVVNIDDAAPGKTEKRNSQTFKSKGGFTVTISDATSGSDKRDTIEARSSDYVSSCGGTSGWIPIADSQSPSTGIWPFQKEGTWYWGYQNTVTGFCNGVAADYDGNPFNIAPGKILSSTRKWQFELEGNGRRVGLKNFVAGHIEFEIHNKSKDNHIPDKDKCIEYLMKMAATDSSCYGSNNKDTKGGTWQVGADKISYHALPAKD